ncbi:cupin [Microbacterium sp. SSW1-49]|uniref:Cupin n=1 Tax=Microbacterium croceum TaxID=2851645 RepID=A0ABT0FCD6_9MICO|nr:cupin [Microbacterium croceum]MCK2035724.1 cupin [Microbacterium croceum]
MNKPEVEFTDIETVPVTPCAGTVAELTERILAADPDSGTATRILYFAPGCDTTPNGVQIHDFWEEVYILNGSITDTRLGQTFTAGMYAVRPPGMPHGPWTSTEGAQTYEVRYPAS